jgi:hypothetical protein
VYTHGRHLLLLLAVDVARPFLTLNTACMTHNMIPPPPTCSAAQAALERLTQQELAEAAGIKLATAGAGRSLAKAIPLIGAAISGAVESYTAEQVARRAKESFAPGDAEVVAECSWCLRTVPHVRTRVGTMARDAFQCSACSNKTLHCTAAGCERMARGGVLWDRGLCASCDPNSHANLSRTSSAQ